MPATTRGERVSVVIANYNMARFLPAAIDSILTQTRPAFEIHVVDDGSTDDTREALRRFHGHPLVFCHFQPNQGQAVAKNRGIRAARGDLIAFLDADDLWTPNKLEIQLPLVAAHPEVGLVYTNFAYIDEAGTFLGSPERQYYSGRVSGQLLIDNFVNGMSSIIPRECFEAVGVFDETLPMGIDYDMWLRLSAHYEFLYLDEITYLYRRWPGQMSHRWEERMEYGIRIMNKFLDAHPDVVDRRTVNEAWAHTYVSRGACAARFAKDRTRALQDYVRALRHAPTYSPAWKSIARLIVP